MFRRFLQGLDYPLLGLTLLLSALGIAMLLALGPWFGL